MVPADVGYPQGADCQFIRACRVVGNRTHCDEYRYKDGFEFQKRTLVYTSAYGEPVGSVAEEESQRRWQPVVPPGLPFNGVIHTDAGINRLRGPERTDQNDPASAPPALASFARITAAAERDITITRDLHIHGVLMTSTGIVSVRSYNQGQPRGDVHLLGGVIQNYYGPFGTFNAQTGNRIAGYGRLFIFDQRTRVGGIAPPYFPTVQADTVTSVAAISFGQREQVVE